MHDDNCNNVPRVRYHIGCYLRQDNALFITLAEAGCFNGAPKLSLQRRSSYRRGE